jgi:SAM-dependent methyltransferase
MNGVQLYLLSEKLMEIAAGTEPEGSALRELPPAARLVLADVGQSLTTTEAEIARRTGLPTGYVRTVVAGLAADGFLEITPGPDDERQVMPGCRLPFGHDAEPLANAAIAAAIGIDGIVPVQHFTKTLDSLARWLRLGTVRPGTAQFDAAYRGTPPWETRRPQLAFAELAEKGAIRGRVLDAGCGTGEHALLAAGLGLPALGVDMSPAAIAIARRKAAERGLAELARFEVHDARDLGSLDEQFDTVLDSGLFHVFADEADRTQYAASLRAATALGGRYFMLAFSDRQPPGFGPRRITVHEILKTFGDGWHVDAIDLVTMDITLDPNGVRAWLAAITRV